MRLAAGAFIALSLTACGGDDEEPAVAVAEINCSSTSLSVTPRVKARADGVHVLAQVSQEHGVSASIDGQPVRGTAVLQLAEGGHWVRCSHGDGGSMEASFAVVVDEEATS